MLETVQSGLAIFVTTILVNTRKHNRLRICVIVILTAVVSNNEDDRRRHDVMQAVAFLQSRLSSMG